MLGAVKKRFRVFACSLVSSHRLQVARPVGPPVETMVCARHRVRIEEGAGYEYDWPSDEIRFLYETDQIGMVLHRVLVSELEPGDLIRIPGEKDRWWTSVESISSADDVGNVSLTVVRYGELGKPAVPVTSTGTVKLPVTAKVIRQPREGEPSP
jgi:hypothetical protein